MRRIWQDLLGLLDFTDWVSADRQGMSLEVAAPSFSLFPSVNPNSRFQAERRGQPQSDNQRTVIRGEF